MFIFLKILIDLRNRIRFFFVSTTESWLGFLSPKQTGNRGQRNSVFKSFVRALLTQSYKFIREKNTCDITSSARKITETTNSKKK